MLSSPVFVFVSSGAVVGVGDRVKGLIFCSRNKECEELSAKFNELGYRTVALSGANSDQERESAFERLAMNAENATDESPILYMVNNGAG